ncbi:hypothetical protein IFN73_10110 [Francisella tularensis subsp. holarctica]|nr:hypothetical protein [Francisella tularensis subsp. holarctica]
MWFVDSSLFIVALMTCVSSLQIVARVVAFRYSYFLGFVWFVVGPLQINISLLVWDFAYAGWLAYPTFSETTYSPIVGTDNYI